MALVESWAASAEWCLSMIPIMGLVVWRQCADKWQLGCAGSKCRLWLGHREIQVIAVRPSCSSAADRLHYPTMPVLPGAAVASITMLAKRRKRKSLPGDACFTRSSCNFDNLCPVQVSIVSQPLHVWIIGPWYEFREAYLKELQCFYGQNLQGVKVNPQLLVNIFSQYNTVCCSKIFPHSWNFLKGVQLIDGKGLAFLQ